MVFLTESREDAEKMVRSQLLQQETGVPLPVSRLTIDG
jgi:hypothetical protein